MPAGLQIFNDYGTILLDENYSNVAMVSKGSVVTERYEAPDSFVDIFRQVIGVAPAAGERIAIACADCHATFYVDSGYAFVATEINGATVEWYRFGNPSPTSNNAGLKVYNAAGVLTFDSNHKQARVFATATSEGSTPTGTAGRKYAVIFGRRGHTKSTIRGIDEANAPGPYNVPLYSSTGAKVVGSAVTFYKVLWNYAPLGALSSPGFVAHIIDVTGY